MYCHSLAHTPISEYMYSLRTYAFFIFLFFNLPQMLPNKTTSATVYIHATAQHLVADHVDRVHYDPLMRNGPATRRSAQQMAHC